MGLDAVITPEDRLAIEWLRSAAEMQSLPDRFWSKDHVQIDPGGPSLIWLEPRPTWRATEHPDFPSREERREKPRSFDWLGI